MGGPKPSGKRDTETHHPRSLSLSDAGRVPKNEWFGFPIFVEFFDSTDFRVGKVYEKAEISMHLPWQTMPR